MKIFSRTHTELSILFKIFKEFYGDDCKVEGNSNITTFLQSINEILDEQHYNHLLTHVSYGFITAATLGTAADILQCCENFHVLMLDQNNDKRLILITGTLLDWKNYISMSASYRQKYELRRLMTLAYNEFKSTERLSFIWNGYDIQASTDKTLIFLEKKC